MTALPVVRGAYGLALLAMPGRLVTAYASRPPSPVDLTVARILGGRQVLQAVASAGEPGRPVRLLGAEVDTLHMLSAIALAVVDRRRRRAGLLDATVAASFAAAGLITAERTPWDRRPIGHTGPLGALARARDLVATAVAPGLLPPAVRRPRHRAQLRSVS